MVIVWGSRLYGKTDEIPGLGYVATQFGHLYYLPLIPVGTHFVISQEGEGWQGAQLRLSGKSVILAWSRAALIIAAAIGLLFVLVSATDATARTSELVISVCITTLVIAAWIATKQAKFFTQASYERAREIADQVGFSKEARVIVDMVYGVISEQEAERRFDAIGEDGFDAFAGQDQFTRHHDE